MTMDLTLDVDPPRLDALEGDGDHPPSHVRKPLFIP